MKTNKNNLLISVSVMTVAYILLLIAFSKDNGILGAISIVAYLSGIVLSIIETIKQYKNKTEIEKITIITIMSFISFFPLGLFYLWTKVEWNKTVKIFATILIPIIAITISVLPLTANDNTQEEQTPAVETISEISTTEAPTTTEPTTQETTTEQTTVSTTKQQTTTTTNATTTTQKETTTQKQSSGRIVYTTPTGEKYHYDKNCAGKNAIEKDINDVKGIYEPCKKCVH